MLYKYSAVLDIDSNKYDEVKGKMDNAAGELSCTYSSLQEMSIKEQLKFYIDKYLPYHTDRVRMLELVDKL